MWKPHQTPQISGTLIEPKGQKEKPTNQTQNIKNHKGRLDWETERYCLEEVRQIHKISPQGKVRVLWHKQVNKQTNNNNNIIISNFSNLTGYQFSIEKIILLHMDFVNKISLLQYHRIKMGVTVNRTPNVIQRQQEMGSITVGIC